MTWAEEAWREAQWLARIKTMRWPAGHLESKERRDVPPRDVRQFDDTARLRKAA